MTTKEAKKMAKANRELLHRVEELQGKVKKVKLQARDQSQKLKQQSLQLEKLKQDKRKVEEELKKKDKVYGILSQTGIERHKYTDLIVSLSVELYTKCHASFRSISNILHILNIFLDWKMESIPCPNSIEN
jgi:rRNA maturation endonuclease Nob1